MYYVVIYPLGFPDKAKPRLFGPFATHEVAKDWLAQWSLKKPSKYLVIPYDNPEQFAGCHIVKLENWLL